MSRVVTQLVKLLVPLIVLSSLLAACSQSQDSPEEVVQAAAQAFVEGYGARNLSTFDTFFASSEDGGDTEGLALIQHPTHRLVDIARPGDSFEIRSLEVSQQELDERNKLATVHYRAEVSIVGQDEVAVYAATVNQDISLIQKNAKWLIAGADPPQVTITSADPDYESYLNSKGMPEFRKYPR